MFKVIYYEETEEVEVYKDGVLLGRCEAYELDAILSWLEVVYEEVESE